MKNLIVLFLGIVVFLWSCDGVKGYQIPEQEFPIRDYYIPGDIKDLVNEEHISKLFGVKKSSIDISQDVSRNKKKLQSFFRWLEEEHGAMKGIFFSMELNGATEYPGNYVRDYIHNIKAVGEYDINSDATTEYQEWTVGTDGGAYDKISQKYVWQIHNHILFTIVINTSHDDAHKQLIAETVAHEINKNYIEGMVPRATSVQ